MRKEMNEKLETTKNGIERPDPTVPLSQQVCINM